MTRRLAREVPLLLLGGGIGYGIVAMSALVGRGLRGPWVAACASFAAIPWLRRKGALSLGIGLVVVAIAMALFLTYIFSAGGIGPAD